MPTETRAVVRCTGCRLNQFLTRSGLCRRCDATLPVPPAAALPTVPKTPEIPFAALLRRSSPPTPAPAPAVTEPLPSYPTVLACATVGETIRQRRMEMGWTQGSLAMFLGWRRTALCDMECDRRLPSLPLRKMLAEALQCRVADLMQPSQARDEAA